MHDDSHDQGLARDLATWLERRAQRREVLHWSAALGAAALAGCGGASQSGSGAGGSSGAGENSGAGGSCSAIPGETAGPYPGDGSNGPNALALSGIVRSDIRQSVDGASGEAEGVLLTVKLRVALAADCAPVAGYAVYLWHCDRDGNYSMYSSAVAGENYLRGVQETDDDGIVSFTTVFPGCYPGRWPHIHFEIYPSLDSATSSGNVVATSQLAFPESACLEAYDANGYALSAVNLTGVSLGSDNVFGDDGAALQLASVSGNAGDGFVAELTATISG